MKSLVHSEAFYWTATYSPVAGQIAVERCLTVGLLLPKVRGVCLQVCRGSTARARCGGVTPRAFPEKDSQMLLNR
jgi:hypothetical protein